MISIPREMKDCLPKDMQECLWITIQFSSQDMETDGIYQPKND